MNVRPLHDRIIIQLLAEGEQKVGGSSFPTRPRKGPSNSGQEMKLDGEEYRIMREDEVLGLIRGGDGKKKK
jgi:co-chaperonin GroES (HSP10)